MGNKVLWDTMQEKEKLLAGEVTDEVGIRLGPPRGVALEDIAKDLGCVHLLNFTPPSSPLGAPG